MAPTDRSAKSAVTGRFALACAPFLLVVYYFLLYVIRRSQSKVHLHGISGMPLSPYSRKLRYLTESSIGHLVERTRFPAANYDLASWNDCRVVEPALHHQEQSTSRGQGLERGLPHFQKPGTHHHRDQVKDGACVLTTY
jgi:hypothetical protein